MNLKNLRIQTKLLLLIGLLISVTLAVSAVGIARLAGMSASLLQVDAAGDAQLSGAYVNDVMTEDARKARADWSDNCGRHRRGNGLGTPT